MAKTIKKYKVSIIGVGQLNGTRHIKSSFITEDFHLAHSFKGANRKEVLKGWVAANYPGIRLDQTLSIRATVETIEEKIGGDDNSPWWKFW